MSMQQQPPSFIQILERYWGQEAVFEFELVNAK
jgi:hypothetical protein